MSDLSFTLLFVSLASAVFYLFTAERGSYRGRAWVKGAAVGALTIYAALAGAWVLALALALCTAGDVFLANPGGRRFLYGLIAFLAGHVVFIVLFALLVDPVSLGPIWGPVVIVVFAAGFSIWIAPKLGKMKVPVLVYIGVITIMVSLAFLATASVWVRVGASFFAVSDTIIAIGKFHRQRPGARTLNWTFYYGAQALIAYGLLSTHPG